MDYKAAIIDILTRPPKITVDVCAGGSIENYSDITVKGAAKPTQDQCDRASKKAAKISDTCDILCKLSITDKELFRTIDDLVNSYESLVSLLISLEVIASDALEPLPQITKDRINYRADLRELLAP